MEATLKAMRDGYKKEMKAGFGAHGKWTAVACGLGLMAEMGETEMSEALVAALHAKVVKPAKGKAKAKTAHDLWHKHLAAYLAGGGEVSDAAIQNAKDRAADGLQQGKNYNARQLTAKIFMNSIFGFSGGTTGPYPFYPLAASITEQGSHMIKDCVHYIENVWPKTEGNMPMKVVYGDTDSVMMCPIAEGVSVEEARIHFTRLEIMLTLLFPPPVEMEYEMLVVRMLRKGPKM